MITSSIGKGTNVDELLNATIFNLHRLCALDIITTGPDPNRHRILEICIYPMNSKYQIARTIIPFYSLIQPPLHPSLVFFPESGIPKKSYTDAYNSGLPEDSVFDLFESWVANKLQLVENKKIMVLTYDWAGKKPFLMKFFGEKNFDHYFFWQVRDILSLALFCNDWADTHCTQVPMSKVDFNYICRSLKIENDMKDTLLRTRALARCYELILFNFYQGMIL